MRRSVAQDFSEPPQPPASAEPRATLSARPTASACGRPGGDVAQLGEHRVRIAGVRGSSPLISTTPLPALAGWRVGARERPEVRDVTTPISVLVVDDEPPIVELVRGYLHREGWGVTVAHDGPTGLELARTGHPDVIVLDLMLPGIDGIEGLRRFKAKVPEIPVILVTAFATVETAVEAIRLPTINWFIGLTIALVGVAGIAAERVLLVSLGSPAEFGVQAFRDAVAALPRPQQTELRLGRDIALVPARLERRGRQRVRLARHRRRASGRSASTVRDGCPAPLSLLIRTRAGRRGPRS